MKPATSRVICFASNMYDTISLRNPSVGLSIRIPTLSSTRARPLRHRVVEVGHLHNKQFVALPSSTSVTAVRVLPATAIVFCLSCRIAERYGLSTMMRTGRAASLDIDVQPGNTAG